MLRHRARHVTCCEVKINRHLSGAQQWASDRYPCAKREFASPGVSWPRHAVECCDKLLEALSLSNGSKPRPVAFANAGKAHLESGASALEESRGVEARVGRVSVHPSATHRLRDVFCSNSGGRDGFDQSRPHYQAKVAPPAQTVRAAARFRSAAQARCADAAPTSLQTIAKG